MNVSNDDNYRRLATAARADHCAGHIPETSKGSAFTGSPRCLNSGVTFIVSVPNDQAAGDNLDALVLGELCKEGKIGVVSIF